MPLPLRLLLLVTLLENVASALIQTGLFFFAENRLQFTGMQNLALAVLHGATYVVGALLSHPLSERLGEKRTLLLVLLAEAALTGVMALRPDALAVWVVSPLILTLYGLKWPIIETFVVAGRTPKQTTAAIGKFNVTWSSAVALAGLFAGVLIELETWALFVASAMCAAVSLCICVVILPKRVDHLPHDHPERPDPALASHYGRLLTSSRWTMMSAYALERVAVPLLPGILTSMGVGVAAASALTTLVAWARSATFAVLGAWPGWHGVRWLPALAALLVPFTALAMIQGPSLPVVLVALALFGVWEGIAYVGSLYYAMVLKNAAVDAGGAHEAVIGGGFVVGPGVGLAAQKLAAVVSPAWLGMSLGLSPLFVVGWAAGLWSLRTSLHDTTEAIANDASVLHTADAGGATAADTSATRPGPTA